MYLEKKMKEIEMKMPKLRNISISRIPTMPDRNYKQVVITYIIIRYMYSLNVKLFTNEVDLLCIKVILPNGDIFRNITSPLCLMERSELL
jgi:hypothetical protein